MDYFLMGLMVACVVAISVAYDARSKAEKALDKLQELQDHIDRLEV